MKETSLENVLSLDWLKQQKIYLKCMKFSYLTAIHNQDEFVKRLLKENERAKLLVKEWINVYAIRNHSQKYNIDTSLLNCWFVFCQTESVLANLFELLTFHSDFLSSIEDYLVDLAELCYNYVLRLWKKETKMENKDSISECNLFIFLYCQCILLINKHIYILNFYVYI